MLILLWNIFPVAASREADIIDEAFLILTILAIPIMALVVVIMGYSVLKFRRSEGDFEDAEYVTTHKTWVHSWLIWTTALCIAVIIFPGWIGLVDIRATQNDVADVTVDVTGQQWVWTYEYPDLDVSIISELVLPVDSLVRFNITARPDDVLHSFWIPAFRMKIDAVPGLITKMDVTTTEIGEFNHDQNFRVQCAELCGLNHAIMFTRVRVVEKDEFDAWVAEHSAS
ncbi:MAG: cytochrome c oxidase subunit II [Chloroflexi bacterium]|nr:cytochrome c oxidase subunit II [Chloroflexota bacterium]